MDRKNALYVNEVLTGTDASTLILSGSYAVVHAVVVALSSDLILDSIEVEVPKKAEERAQDALTPLQHSNCHYYV